MTNAHEDQTSFRRALNDLFSDSENYKKFKNDPEAFALSYGLTSEHIRAIELLPERVFTEWDHLKGVNFSDLMRR